MRTRHNLQVDPNKCSSKAGNLTILEEDSV